jgi:hypothetical protein
LGKARHQSTPAYSDRMSTPVEKERLNAEAARAADWKRWGPYLSERQWATVRRIIRRWEIPGATSPHLPAGDGEFAIQVIGGADQR